MAPCQRTLLRPTTLCLQCPKRSFATTLAYRQVQTGAPAMLAQFRIDMKEAMKAKDTQRLNTLRGILTETTSLEKQSQGIASKSELFKLLQKRQKACAMAAKEFQDAGREDLVGKENEQISVLQGYLDEFEVLTKDQTVTAIQDLVNWMESKGASPRRGTVRKQLFEENGAFHDQIVDDHLVTMTINDLVEDKPPLKKKPRKEREKEKLKEQAGDSDGDAHLA